MQNKIKKNSLFHFGFEIGLLLKGLHGIFEIITGFLFIFLNPTRINNIIGLLTKDELSEGKGDFISNLLLSFSSHFSVGTQHFAMFYLLSHGIIKTIIVLLLWRKKLWAYPLCILTFILFMGYQIYRFTFTHSIFMIIFTILDLIMIILTYHEYRMMEAKKIF